MTDPPDPDDELDRAQPPGRTDKGRERAAQILDAGRAAATSRSARDLLPSRSDTLRATHGDRSGLSPASAGSFRNLFGSLEEFHRRLVEERLLVTHPVVPETIELLAQAAEDIESGNAVNLADLLGRIARHNLEVNLADHDAEQARMLSFAAALAPGGDFAAAALREDYRHFTDEFTSLYDEILAAWGTRLREPFDTRSLAVVLAALADGLTLRHLVDPDSVDLTAYRHSVVALLLLLVARPGDDRDIVQLIAEVFPQPERPAPD